MFGEHISRSPPSSSIPSPWSRLSTSASTSASTTAPPTPPPDHLVSVSGKGQEEDGLPALHLLNMASEDSLSDSMSDDEEADGFFSLDMDVSIDKQLDYTSPSNALASRDASASPRLSPAVRRVSETAYSSSPLQRVGLDPIMASRSRASPNPPDNAKVKGDASPSSFGPIAPEVDQKGNLEYKLKILPPSRERFDRLVTQLKWRLLEGGGLAVYEIGVLDDGTLIGLDLDSMKDSLKLLSLMAAEVGAKCCVQRVLALEKVDGEEEVKTSARLAKAEESDLSLRALAPKEAEETLLPYVVTAGEVQAGAGGLYRFEIADQLTVPPPALARETSIAAVDPADTVTTEDESELAISASTKRRLLKSTTGLPPSNTRVKKDILEGLPQSDIVYLPSKEEKRIFRAAIESQHLATVERALSHTEAQERRMMAKMVRVADTVQPKTARARARARKGKGDSDSSDQSGEVSPAMRPTVVGASAGYENVLSSFGVLSERSARAVYGNKEAKGEEGGVRRLIVEAVVRRDVDSEDNYVDFQGAKSKLGEA